MQLVDAYCGGGVIPFGDAGDVGPALAGDGRVEVIDASRVLPQARPAI